MTNEVYAQMLDELFADYEGEWSGLLRRIPIYFRTLQDILINEHLPWVIKHKVNACFSYFAVPEDLISDSLGAVGYIDDLYLCAYTLNELLRHNQGMVVKYWREKSSPNDDVKVVLEQTADILKGKTDKILSFVGLAKFNDMYEEREMWFQQEDAGSRLFKLDTQVLDLMSLLKSLFLYEGKKPRNRKMIALKELMDKSEWSSVLNILEQVELHESCYDHTHEEELDRIRRKVILEVDEGLLDG